MTRCLRNLAGSFILLSFAAFSFGEFGKATSSPITSGAQVADQGSLTLEEAIRIARERNGTVRAAELNVRSAQAQVAQSFAAFLPDLTGQYQYQNINRERDLQTFVQKGDATLLNFSWQLLDSGQRDFTYRSSRRSRDAARFTARQTLRSTLFTVTQQFYEALRAQELKRVADSQVARAQTLLDQTKARIAVRDAAPIDELQANADFQNAKVNALTARNRVTNAAAALTATLGYAAGESLPTLVKDTTVPVIELKQSAQELIAQGLKIRPDLRSRRLSIEALGLSRQRAIRDAGIGLSVDFFDNYQLTPKKLNDRTFQVTASMPLFDGGQRRAAIKEQQLNIEADRASLLQAERTAQSDIEAAYAALSTNLERLSASQLAVDAARKNYEATLESRKANASDLLQVLTAQVSLVTAESNYIEALYDTRISEAQLRLASGQPVVGEPAP